jgi:trypsin
MLMRRIVAVMTGLLGAVALWATPATAITGNYVEDFQHPFVGLIVFYDDQGEFSHRCSGSLLTPIVFLTAGHCTEGVDSARVYFQQDAGANFDPETELDPVTGYPEFCAPGTQDVCTTSDELYNFGFHDFVGFPNTRDAGLAILDRPISLPEYGVLAAAGSLNRLATSRGQQAVIFTTSGYGLSRTNPVFDLSFRSRLMAKTQLVNLTSALTGGFNLQTTANPGGGKGGTCFGDSGGPVFYGGFSSNTIVGVTSFGLNANCRGVDFAYRTDRNAVIQWILDHVPQSEVNDIRIVSIS